MSETKEFPTLAVVSATTGRLACDIGELYKILGWLMRDDSIMTHQLPAAASEAEAGLIEQFPWLDDLDLPKGGGEEFTEAVARIVDEHGPTLTVQRLEDPAWVLGNALRDLAQLADGRPIFMVDGEQDGSET